MRISLICVSRGLEKIFIFTSTSTLIPIVINWFSRVPGFLVNYFFNLILNYSLNHFFSLLFSYSWFHINCLIDCKFLLNGLRSLLITIVRRRLRISIFTRIIKFILYTRLDFFLFHGFRIIKFSLCFNFCSLFLVCLSFNFTCLFFFHYYFRLRNSLKTG